MPTDRFDTLDGHAASMVAVPPLPNPKDDPSDAAALAAHAEELLAAVDAALPRWVERVVRTRWVEWSGEAPSSALISDAVAAGERARVEVTAALGDLLAADVEAQRSNPLAIIRQAVVHAADVLAGAGVPPVERDTDAVRIFPGDHYDLSPASFADLDAATHETGLSWGAAKVHVILARRR